MQFTFISLTLAFRCYNCPIRKEHCGRRNSTTAGKVDEAIRIYRNLLTNSPRNAVLLMNRCIANTQPNSQEAVATSLQVSPIYCRRCSFWGRVSWNSAIFFGHRLFETGYRCHPASEWTLMLGEALLNAGQSRRALEEFSAAAEMLPNSRASGMGLGARAKPRADICTDDAWARLAALPSLNRTCTQRDAQRTAALARSGSQWQEALRTKLGKPAVRVGLGNRCSGRDYRRRWPLSETPSYQ